MVVRLRSALPLAKAETIVDAALRYGRERSMEPLVVAVLDASGQLVALKREDGSGILRNEIAIAKAWGALGMGMPARIIAERMAANPGFQTALIAASDGRMVPGAGGVLILDETGVAIGAVGISGDIGPNDELCALAGIAAAGLKSDPPAAG